MLTVLQVAYPFAPVTSDAVGGAERILSRLDETLTARGHRSLVVACESSHVCGTLFPVPALGGVIDERARSAVHEEVRAAIARALASEPVDVVHLHGLDFDAYLPVGVPRVVTLHLPIDWYPPAALQVEAAFVCVSESQRRTCPVAAITIPNGVHLDAFRPRSRPRGFVLALGRICPEKGYDVALQAAERAGVPLLLAGHAFGYPEHLRYLDGVLRPLLRPPSRFIGPIAGARKRRLLAAARCLLVPSRAPESSSLVAMEALASGTPVVAYPAGALVEIVEPGVTGALVEGVQAMAAAIRGVGALSRAACRRAAERRFSETPMIDAYLDLYSACARRSGVRPAPPRVEDVSLLPDLERALPEWADLWERIPDATPFQRPEWLIAWQRHLSTASPVVRLVRQGARLVGVLPFGVWDDGALRLLGEGVSDYLDVLVEPGAEAEVTSALRDLLSAHHGGCEGNDLPEGSILARAALDGAGPAEPFAACPRLGIEAAAPTLLPAGFARRLDYARRRAAREGLVIEDLAGDALDEYLEALFRLHAARWRRRGEDGVLAGEAVRRFHREAAGGLHRAGLLAMHGLRAPGGELVAVSYGFLTPRRGYLYLSGFDPVLGRLSPGALVVYRAILAARAAGARGYDFLRGQERYKYDWGATDRWSLRRHLRVVQSGAGHAATTVRRFRAADRGALVDLAPLDHEALVGRAIEGHHRGDNLILVAEQGGVVVGQVWVDLSRRRAEGVAIAWALRVRADRRERGVGGALLDEVERVAADLGFGRVEVGVLPDALGPRAFYERRGYACVGRRVDDERWQTPGGEARFARFDQFVLEKEVAPRERSDAGDPVDHR